MERKLADEKRMESDKLREKQQDEEEEDDEVEQAETEGRNKANKRDREPEE